MARRRVSVKRLTMGGKYELYDLLSAAKAHGIPFWALFRAATHAAMDTWGPETAAQGLLGLMEAQAPQVREMIEPMLVMALAQGRTSEREH